MALPPLHRWLALGLLGACCAAGLAAEVRAGDAKPAPLGEADRKRLRQADQLLEKARRLVRRGKYAAARKLAERVLATRRKLLGANAPATGRAMTELGAIHKHLGEYAKARTLLQEAVDTLTAAQGKAHPDRAAALHQLAGVHFELAEYAKARALYEEALAVRKQALGTKHADYAATLNNLGLLHRERGEYAAALRLLVEARTIRRAALGEKHPDYAASLINLGALFCDLGLLGRARERSEKAVELTRANPGADHPAHAGALSNLAGLYRAAGDDEKALPLYEKARDIFQKALGDRHPSYALSLNNLAVLYAENGNRGEAEKLYGEALRLLKERLGEKHPDYVFTLSNRAILAHDLGRSDEARGWLETVVKLRKAAVGDKHPAYATALHNLACVLRDLGQFDKALPLYTEALAIRKQVLGDKHPDYAKTLCHLGLLHLLRGRPEQAEPLLRDGLGLLRRHLDDAFTDLPERLRLAQANRLRQTLDQYLSVAVKPGAPAVPVYEMVLGWKGVVSGRSAEERRARGEPALAKPFARLALARAGLARLAGSRPGPAGYENWLKRFRDLERDKESVEAQITRASAAFRQQKEVSEIKADQVAAALPSRTSLVDYFVYTRYTPAAGGKPPWRTERRLLAFVLAPGKRVVLRELGPAGPVEDAVARWRLPLTRGLPRIDQGAALQLRRLVWEPVERELGTPGTVLLAPDGVLCGVAFPALPGPVLGRFLIEDWTFGHVTSGRQLVALGKDRTGPPGEGLLALGGVDYGQAPSGGGPRGLGGKPWAPLPCALVEAAQVAAVYRKDFNGGRGARRLQGTGAGKAHLLRALTPANGERPWRYVHLATHGFFGPALEGPNRGAAGPNADKLTFRRNPLLQSGLVLAGANNSTDGLLTAEEVASLDLRGTEQVVLSACQSGLGRVAVGEGVLGLQRAFQAAGARTLVSSLWNVSDAATCVLMEEFYKNEWERKMGRLEALRQAQLQVLRNPKLVVDRHRGLRGKGLVLKKLPEGAREDPKAGDPSPVVWWAAFVLSGDAGK